MLKGKGYTCGVCLKKIRTGSWWKSWWTCSLTCYRIAMWKNKWKNKLILSQEG